MASLDISQFPRSTKYSVLNPASIPYPTRFTITYPYGMNTDFSDMRFHAVDGTNIPYWIESKTDGVEATVRVLLPPKEVEFFMRWGNPNAVSESDGEAVFEFFDGFDGTELDTEKWDVKRGDGLSVINGNLHVSRGGNNSSHMQMFSRLPVQSNIVIGFRIQSQTYVTSVSHGNSDFTGEGSSIGLVYYSAYESAIYTGTKFNASLGPLWIPYRSFSSTSTAGDIIPNPPRGYYVEEFAIPDGESLKERRNFGKWIISTRYEGISGSKPIGVFHYRYYGNMDMDYIYAHPYLASEPTVVASDPFEGCVAYYPFNGDAKDVIGGHDGTVTGATLTDVNGVVNRAYHFDGDDYITTVFAPTFDEYRTVVAWVKFDLDTDYGHIIGVGQNQYEYPWATLVRYSDNRIYATYGAMNGWMYKGCSIPCPTDNNYHQIVAIYGGTQTSYDGFKIYMDGVLQDTTPLNESMTPLPITGNVIMGRNSAWVNTAQMFNGDIGEVFIYDRVLSQDEITDLYNLTKYQYETENPVVAGLMDGCIAYWPMHGDAQDIVGGHDGTVTGATPALGRFNEQNGAYSFGGNPAWIQIQDNLDLRSNQFSIAFWVKLDTSIDDPHDARGYICSIGDNNGRRGYRVCFSYTQSWVLEMRVGGAKSGSAFHYYSKSDLQSNVWTHIVITQSEAEWKVYFNGSLDATVDAPSSRYVWASTMYAYWGRRSYRWSTTDTLKYGKLSDGMHFDLALTPEQVKALYDITKHRYLHVEQRDYEELFDGCVAYYPFNGSLSPVIGEGDATQSNMNLVANRFGNEDGAYTTVSSSSVVTIPHQTAFEVNAATDSYAIAFWINGQNVTECRIYEKGVAGGTKYPFSIQVDSVYVYFCVYDGVLAKVDVPYEKLYDGLWHFVTFVVTKPNLEVYIDGISVGTAQNTISNDTANTDSLYVANNSEIGKPFDGYIGEFWWFNGEFSAEMVKALYDLTKEKYIYPLIGGERR